MPRPIRILPYSLASEGYRLLQTELERLGLDALGIRLQGSRYEYNRRHIVINWGWGGERPRWWVTGLNDPNRVNESISKLRSLPLLRKAGVPVPLFTTDADKAREWCREGKVVVGRRLLAAEGGRGIEIWEHENDHPNGCRLYTQHLRHKREYRVHVFNGRVIDSVEKKRRNGAAGKHAWVRSFDNGYVFARNGVRVPEVVTEVGLAACAAHRLDFGAVDVGFREKEGRAFVFEVNTAPGIEGTTVARYARAIQEIAG